MKLAARHARQVVALVFVSVGSQVRANAQTPVLNPGNGHYYMKVSAPGLTWSQARAAAEAMTYQGFSGHLATITDAAEQNFTQVGLPSTAAGMWIGGYQDHNSLSYSEPSGGWTWVTGEPWNFTAWRPNQPDNAGSVEDYLEWSPLGTPANNWNDLPNVYSLAGYIVEYENGSGPIGAYCTAGTTSNGCNAMMSADHNPSVTLANSCHISITSVEGLKTGIIFYGIDNTGFTPSTWGTGTSYLCVKHPTQRTPAQYSNGSFNTCDGQLSIDWNAFQTTHPMSLGNPWSVGDDLYVQGWFRDPPAVKTTNLSNALHLIYVP